MRKLHYFPVVLASFALLACSSMTADEPLSEVVPEDFDVAVYAKLNPDVPIAQLKDQVDLFNKPKLDSIQLSTVTAEQRKEIRARIALDDSLFSSDTAMLHWVLVNLSGFTEADWSDSILTASSQKNKVTACTRFNFQGLGNAEDWARLKAFQPDMDLVVLQYNVYGAAEGRPYKYCEAGKMGALKEDVEPTIKTSKGFVDYRPHAFCLHTDNNIYEILTP